MLRTRFVESIKGRTMYRFLLQCAAVGLMALLAPTPASAAKKGGVLRVYQYDSPASMSIHEEALNSAQNPIMAVFNNLVIFKQDEELCAKVGDGLTGRRRRIVGVFEPPLLQQRSDTPCRMLTSSSCFNQGRSPTRLPRCCATERAPCWPKRSRPRWPNSSLSMSI